MRIKIDTGNKVIELEDTTKLSDLLEFLQDSIKDWKEYEIIAVRPEYIPYYPVTPSPPPIQPNPWEGPWVYETPYTTDSLTWTVYNPTEDN